MKILSIYIASFFLDFCVFLSISPCYPQTNTGTLLGKALDRSNRPIASMHVYLRPNHIGTTTDRKGEFRLTSLPAGTYTVVLDHIAFRLRVLENIRVEKTETVDLGTLIFEEQVIVLPKIVVTATRGERLTTEIPQPVNRVSQAEIAERQAKTSAEALREETGIFVQKTNHGGGSAILRGMGSNQILILVDGVRLNNSTYRLGNHPYLTTVDCQMLDRIEAVRGPGSVLYGSDALGGTLHLFSRPPKFTTTGLRFHGNFFGRYGTADKERTGRTDVSIQSPRFYATAGFTVKQFKDLRRGRASDHPELEKSTNGLLQSPSGYSEWNADAKAAFRLSPNTVLTLAHQRTDQKDVPRYDKYEDESAFRWMYQPIRRSLSYLSLDSRFSSLALSSLRAVVSWNVQEEGREIQNEADSPLTLENDRVDTWGLSLQTTHEPARRLHLTAGAEVYGDRVASERFTKDPDGHSEKDVQGRYPDNSRYSSFGVFVQSEWRPFDRWTVVAGLRESLFRTEFTLPNDPVFFGPVTLDFHSLTGNLGIVHHLLSGLFLDTNVRQGFRAPNLSDLTKLGESKGQTYEVPNPGLKPESVFSVDFGLKTDLVRFRAEASIYSAWISDLIASTDALYLGSPEIEVNSEIFKVKSKANTGKASIQGIELSFFTLILRNLSMSANVTGTIGKNHSLHEPVGGIPPLFGRIGIRWSFAAPFSTEWYVRFAGRQDRLSSDDLDDPRIPLGGTPGWYTINGRILWNWKDRLVLEAALENLLDANYREHGSGINGPGRNFVFSVQIKA